MAAELSLPPCRPTTTRLYLLTMALLTTAGTVIEADDDQDLPEQMLAGVYLTYLDPAKCRPFDPTLTRYLNDERNLIPPLTGSL